MIVLDASAAIEWLLGLPRAEAVTARFGDETLHAPHLLTVEVAQVVRRYTAAGDLSAERGMLALGDLVDLDVVHHPHEPLIPTMWRLRENLTTYDAAYVALALALDAPLVTLDAGIAAAAGHGATVDVIG